jgi:hypothetical protein
VKCLWFSPIARVVSGKGAALFFQRGQRPRVLVEAEISSAGSFAFSNSRGDAPGGE